MDEQRRMLVVAKAKRVFIYKYDGNKDFGEVKDLPALDAVKCMAWVNDSLCLGIKREYVILNISTGASFDVFPYGRDANPLAVSLPNGELLLGKEVSDFADDCAGRGKRSTKNSQSLKGGNLGIAARATKPSISKPGNTSRLPAWTTKSVSQAKKFDSSKKK